MKKCPYCAEEIQDEAIKCRYCSEFLVDMPTPPQVRQSPHQPQTKWYFAKSFIIIALLCVGPFALPLVWLNPNSKLITKITVSIIVIALTILLYNLTADVYYRLNEQLSTLGIR